MTRISLIFLVSLFCALLAVADSVSPSMQLVLSRRPQLQDGGATPQSFAAWANTRYLLQDACYLGMVTSLGEGVEAHLCIHAGRPVLVFWSKDDQSLPVTIKLGTAAKLYAWGDKTRALRGTTLKLNSEAIPLFVSGVARSYVIEAVRATLVSQGDIVQNEAGTLLDRKYVTGWNDQCAVIMRLLDTARFRDISAKAAELQAVLQTMIEASAALPKEQGQTARFSLYHHLLLAQLQLDEIRLGIAQWQGQLPESRPLSQLEQIKLSNTLVHLLATAAPRTALRGYPVSAQLLRDALADISRPENDLSAREQHCIALLCILLPQLLALEPAATQNLEATASVSHADGKYTLLLTLRNASTEDATGAIQFAWGEEKVNKQFRLVPGAKGELSFPLATAPAADFSVKMTGNLTDGTPIAGTISVTR